MRRRSSRACVLAAAVLAAASHAGCDAGDAPDDGAAEPADAGSVAFDSAGIRITDSSAPLWPEGRAGEAWRLADAPSVEIGVVDGPAEYQLDEVTDVLRLPDGRILVLDGGSRELRFFGPEGGHLRTAGRRGRGPGEFEDPAGLAVVQDSLWVFDSTLGRISVFDREGEFARSFAPDPTGDPIRPLRMYRLAGTLGGRRVALVARFWPADMQPEPTVFWDAVESLLYSADGQLLGTVGPPRGLEMEAGVTADGRRYTGSRQFGRQSAGALGDSLLWHSDAERFEIRAYDADDRVRRIVRAAIEPRELDEGRWGDLVDEALSDAEVPPGRMEAVRRRFEGADLPDHEPAHGPGMVVGEAGHLWVQEYSHPMSGRVPGWQVFDPDGRWLGRVAAPDRPDVARFVIHQAGPWGVLAGWRDGMGVERVGLWEVER